ncbi:MAG: response regulator [Epsilonproteobacteria bacterium]|nr:response regulator [Campylobacterota bacterium]
MKKKLNILSVDDDFINLKLVGSILKRNENVNKVVEASNGLEALEQLKKNDDINLILLDLVMPVMDGLKFLDSIGTEEKYKNIPIIVLTTDETKKYESFEKGVYDFIVKPVREHVLNEKIDKIVEVFYS